MQLSYFLKIYRAPDYPAYRLYFSTRRAALALVPEEMHQLLVTGDIAEVPPEQLDSLSGIDILVPDHAKERQEVDNGRPGSKS